MGIWAEVGSLGGLWLLFSLQVQGQRAQMRIPARLWLPSGALSSSTASSIAKSNENTTVVLSGGAGMVSCAAGTCTTPAGRGAARSAVPSTRGAACRGSAAETRSGHPEEFN